MPSSQPGVTSAHTPCGCRWRGRAAAAIAMRRKFVECLVVADYDLARATAVVDRLGDPRLVAARLDATDETAVRDALAAHSATALLNATDPRFVMPLYRAALAGGATYLDMAMSLSAPHPETPHERTGVKLGDEQFALEGRLARGGPAGPAGHRGGAGALRRLRPLRRGPPVLPDRRAGRARRRGPAGRGTRVRTAVLDLDALEECLNPPVVWEHGRGWYTSAAVQRAGGVRIPRPASARWSA